PVQDVLIRRDHYNAPALQVCINVMKHGKNEDGGYVAGDKGLPANLFRRVFSPAVIKDQYGNIGKEGKGKYYERYQCPQQYRRNIRFVGSAHYEGCQHEEQHEPPALPDQVFYR